MIDSASALTATLLPLLLTRLGLPFFISWQAGKKFLTVNFEGKKIATAGGAILFLSLLFGYPFFLSLPLSLKFPWTLLFFYLFGITLLGVIDDIWGEKKCKGLRAHLRKFCKGEGISTGMYKAAGGLLLGTFVSTKISGGYWLSWLIGGLYLALLSNLFNLLDTRPGRSIKTFFLTSLPLIFYHNFAWLLIPIWGVLAIYLPWEENKQIMLGDTGAYMLGGILGFSSLFVLSGRSIIFLNVFLLFLHLFCEKFSLNSIMEKMLWIGRKS
jgi:UDP-GlcNAc:undecaprenyl-phosphate GlcNAc-1-phosphate transferase